MVLGCGVVDGNGKRTGEQVVIEKTAAQQSAARCAHTSSGGRRAQQWGFSRLVLLLVIGALIGLFFTFDLSQYLTLAYLKEVRTAATAFVAENPSLSTLGFFAIYVLVTGLSLPGAAIMTLAAGAIFGFWWGLLVVSFASTIGATLAMVISRSLLRNWVQARFAQQLVTVNEGLQRDGAFYLFSIRMVPLFPFFIVNLVMGLTRISAWQFYWVSQTGMFAGTIFFVFAGTQLAQLSSIGDVLSPVLIGALTALGLFPLIARKTVQWLTKLRRVNADQTHPDQTHPES